jgi:hypothetical protein
MNKPLALQTKYLSPQWPHWGSTERGFFTEDFERNVTFFFIRVCAKEGSGNGHISP